MVCIKIMNNEEIIKPAQETLDNRSQIEILGDGAYVRVKIVCPNCGRVAKVKKIKSDQLAQILNIRCKCPIAGFDWKYEPPQSGDLYLRINTSASVVSRAKMITFNERLPLSNK